MIGGGEVGERGYKRRRTRGGGVAVVETSRGDRGANGALTVLHSGSSISITLWVSV